MMLGPFFSTLITAFEKLLLVMLTKYARSLPYSSVDCFFLLELASVLIILHHSITFWRQMLAISIELSRSRLKNHIPHLLKDSNIDNISISTPQIFLGLERLAGEQILHLQAKINGAITLVLIPFPLLHINWIASGMVMYIQKEADESSFPNR